MNNLMIFQNEDFGMIRTMSDNEEIIWFVGKDVAEILGYKDTKNVIQDHVDEEDKIVGKRGETPFIIDELGRKQYPTWINESGVYSLIFNSKLPAAKKLKHWVTSEVLPSIRKTGMYLPEEVRAQIETLQEFQTQQLALNKEHEIRLGIMESQTVHYKPSGWVAWVVPRIEELRHHYEYHEAPYTFSQMMHELLRRSGIEDWELTHAKKVFTDETGEDGKCRL